MDHASCHYACHGALHRNDTTRGASKFLEDGDEVAVPMGRWTAPEAEQVAKTVSMRRRGAKPHPSSLAKLDGLPAAAGVPLYLICRSWALCG